MHPTNTIIKTLFKYDANIPFSYDPTPITSINVDLTFIITYSLVNGDILVEKILLFNSY